MCKIVRTVLGSPLAQMVKNQCAIQWTQVQSLGWEDPLEKGKVMHFRILAWRIPWTEEPDGLQSMQSQRVTNTVLLWVKTEVYLDSCFYL